MVEISPLTESDRAAWQTLARNFKDHFGTEASDADYEQTWQRLLNRTEIRGIAARQNNVVVGIAHYYFHTSVWAPGDSRCYLQDLFVDKEIRRQGIAKALIEYLAEDARTHGATRLHWHTPQDNTEGRAFYDKVAKYKGYIAYSRRLTTT